MIKICRQIATAVKEELISIFTAFYHVACGQALTTYLEYFESIESVNKRFRCHYANLLILTHVIEKCLLMVRIMIHFFIRSLIIITNKSSLELNFCKISFMFISYYYLINNRKIIILLLYSP